MTWSGLQVEPISVLTKAVAILNRARRVLAEV